MPDPTASPTDVYDSYWRFAAERQAMYERRVAGVATPLTSDPILRSYRFTNAFRAADRVSQYLISEVQYGEGRSQAPAELLFRTLLFKLFNRIETWNTLERKHGPLSWQSADFDALSATLNEVMTSGGRVYSAAYIMPAPKLGRLRKHDNHLALLAMMMADGLAGKLERARSLDAAYSLIKPYPGLGPFLAFQYVIDINYSELLDFDEREFVVAGPGALDGIAKCFGREAALRPEEVIYAMVERQSDEFARLDLSFSGLFGRPLMPIDCQNLFCEISKYARVAHPDVPGLSGRTRIKQSYAASPKPLPKQVFPPRWGLTTPDVTNQHPERGQLRLFEF